MKIYTELNIGDKIYIIYDKDYYEIEIIDYIEIKIWDDNIYITYSTKQGIKIDEKDDLHNGKYCTSLKEIKKAMAKW